ncbi:hypothetical protein PAPYR_5488 [Paratrimastix pyriformis]|uniref:Uncharacterized protein n=1 Tax=Paratrimastix pyriformis TaxID=342808 RepID=A0ABQ8UJX8_9EUKA|nr:hypothetical protein PAPYR_5488 [Paratrimastix pyriformis]
MDCANHIRGERRALEGCATLKTTGARLRSHRLLMFPLQLMPHMAENLDSPFKMTRDAQSRLLAALAECSLEPIRKPVEPMADAVLPPNGMLLPARLDPRCGKAVTLPGAMDPFVPPRAHPAISAFLAGLAARMEAARAEFYIARAAEQQRTTPAASPSASPAPLTPVSSPTEPAKAGAVAESSAAPTPSLSPGSSVDVVRSPANVTVTDPRVQTYI